MGMKKLFCGCCGLGGRTGSGVKGTAASDEGLEGDGADYVRQDDKKVKRKSKSSSKSKSKSSKEVELV